MNKLCSWVYARDPTIPTSNSGYYCLAISLSIVRALTEVFNHGSFTTNCLEPRQSV